MPQAEGYDEAVQAFIANVSPRFLRLDELERWRAGTQYDDRPNWWTGGPKECPLFERKPCVIYPVVDVAISSNVDLVLGEGRFPTVTSKPAEDESEKEGGLGDEESEAVDRLLREYGKLARLKAHAREAFGAAQSCGTAIGLHGHRNGKPFAELVPAKWGNPRLNVDGSVELLEIRYPYLDEIKVDGKWVVRAKLYRRVITPTQDVTFFPADAREDGAEPEWTPDPDKSVDHNLGFCPVVWYPFMRGASAVNRIDGHAIHENLRDEILDLDLALSIKQHSMLHSMPQPVELGVSPEHNPTAEQGRMPVVVSTEHGGHESLGDPGKVTGAYIAGGGQPARKTGPGFMWRYPDPQTKVEYLSFPAGLLKEQEEHCNDLLGKIEQGLAVVLPKPSDFKFSSSVSGRSIQEVKSRQFDRCDQYRDDFEEGFLLPTVNMQLRIAQRVREQLKVPGIQAALPTLDKFNADAVAAA